MVTKKNAAWARMFVKGRRIFFVLWGTFVLFIFLNLSGAILTGTLIGPVKAEYGFVPEVEDDERSFELFLVRFEREYPAKKYRVESGESDNYPACGEGSRILVYETTMLDSMLQAPLQIAEASGLWNCRLAFMREASERDAGKALLFGYVPGFLLIAGLTLAARSRPGWRKIVLHWQPEILLGRAISAGAATGLAALLIALTGGFVLSASGLSIDVPTDSMAEVDPTGLLLLMVFFAPVVEEYIFRAWLQGKLGVIIGQKVALITATALFVAAHLPASFEHALVLLIPGLALGMLWMKTRSLTACCIAHGLFNLGVIGTWLVTA